MTKYWRSVASVLTGAALAQVIPIVGSLVIARQFAPAEFGEFSVWLGIVLLLAVLLPCRFEMALAIEDDGEPRRLAVVSTLMTACLLGCVIAALIAIGLILVPYLLAKFSFVLILAWLPAALAIAASNIWQSWAAAEGQYRRLSTMRIAQAAAVTLIQITMGVFQPSAGALAIAQVLGGIVGLAVSAYLLPLGRFPVGQTLSAIGRFWKRQRQFPTFSLPAGLINTAAAQLPVLIVASRFGADVAGLLAMTIKVLGAPSGLLGKSVLDVFKRHAASSFRERGECRDEYLRTFKVLALGSFLFCAIMVFVSEPLFALAFGEAWRGAGTIAVWLLPLFALRFIASPLSYMVYIAGKQHLDLFWQIGLLCVTGASLGALTSHKPALQAYGLTCGILYMIYLAMSYRFSLGVKNR